MKFQELVKGIDEQAESTLKEKHVPVIEIEKEKGVSGMDIVRVYVGKETPHPNKVEHHIAWIALFGVKKDNDQVINLGRSSFAPIHTNHNAAFEIRTDDFKTLCATEYCNIHGHWKK